MMRTSRTTSSRALDRALDNRLAAMRELVASGLSAEESAFWCAAWEAEAERQKIRPESQYFWDAGRGWIDAERSFRKGM
jgi:hypothetical protein